MTIEKGQAWGIPAPDVKPEHSAGNDAELASLAGAAVAEGHPLVASVTAGDLLATLGLSQPRPIDERFAYPIDLGQAFLRSESDGLEAGPFPFVAHLIVGHAGRSPWPASFGPLADLIGGAIARALGHGVPCTVAAMNAAWLGDLRLGPKAHPNDGLLDVTEGQVGFRERREAVSRARSGSHLPHPALSTSRVAQWSASFDRPRSVSLDGVAKGRFMAVRIELVPDAITVVA
ncbi:MAG: hypothetical protein ACRBK7_16625 [Acidimicrobiales bacterium]